MNNNKKHNYDTVQDEYDNLINNIKLTVKEIMQKKEKLY